jgi:hypothetical protein
MFPISCSTPISTVPVHVWSIQAPIFRPVAAAPSSSDRLEIRLNLPVTADCYIERVLHRAAAERVDDPSDDAFKTRDRRSPLSAFPITASNCLV